jgi:hypothetical protein
MPYIGKSPVGGGFHKLDNLTASATATYALTLGSAAYYPETANQLLVSLNGVIQAPQDSFTVSGSNLVFDSALTASDSIDFIVALGDVLGVGSVTDGAVTTAKIANGAVTAAKLAAGAADVAGITTASTSGTALNIDANNIVTTPANPAFSATSTGAYNITSGIISYNSEQFDVGGNYDASTYRFTCPIAGVYSFSFSYFAVNTINAMCALYKNASLFAIGNRTTNDPDASPQSTTVTILMQCAASDVIDVRQYEGTPHINLNFNHFSGYLVS